MELEVYKTDGKKTGQKVKLNKAIFGIEPNDHAIWLDTKQHMANQRQGTSKAKERAEITGSRRKIKRQKGTGTARFGDIKNPIFRGGGRTFGPRPRDYGFKLNKKVKRLARKSALSYKAKDNQIKILEDFNFEEPKTKSYTEILNNLEVADKKTLLVLNDANKNIYLSARNIPNAKVVRAADLNTYDILNNNNLLFVESSIKEIENVLSK
ncbi:MAG: 50S ribosomal protein L4 [Flavobacteriales bacterium]|nr:MAG: 50S ribosomal protein L4 [Flavobacteriales bacterium]